MKYLVLVVAFLSCAVASAIPKVGDYSLHNVTLNGFVKLDVTQGADHIIFDAAAFRLGQ